MTLVRSSSRIGLLGLAWCAVISSLLGAEPEKEKPADASPSFTAAQIAFFENEVQPILKANCLKCHGGESVKGELRLTSRASVLRGGEQGEAVSLKKPESSLLLDAINYKELKMPPSGKLAPEKAAILTRWVKEGLPWTPGAEANEPVVEKKKIDIEAGRQYWAYQPVKRPAPPVTKNTKWATSPIDQFVLAKLEEHNLSPNGPADKIALGRRAYYDLTGLPPSPEELDRFVNDRTLGAYERLLDELLESPQYGEKWGRHWLDLVRYAESNGYERDDTKPNAWRFRDYVIESFNADKPYDRFILEQLAGDELFTGDDDAIGIIATGYYRLGIWDDEPADRLLARYDELDDIVATTSQTFLGMTMNCVRCHDHKRDPIPHEDYYRLLAFFQDIRPYTNSVDARGNSTFTDISPGGNKEANDAEVEWREVRRKELDEKIVEFENAAIKKLPAEDQRASEGPERGKVISKLVNTVFTKEEKRKYQALKVEFNAVDRKPLPEQKFALSVNQCITRPPETTLLIRGNANSPGKVVEAGFPAVLTTSPAAIPPPAKDAKTSGRRGALAKWIASKENPLTARVMMNRVWQQHFGRGLVGTPNDFGKLGQAPSHPELLDWLASEFMAGDWRLKRMHKLMMLSSTYRMSSAGRPEALAVDGNNNWWWRFNMRRLAAEEVRDSVLAMSGELNLKSGGPSVYVTIPQEVLAGQSKPGQGWGKSPPEDAARRSVYVFVKRSLQVPILSQHDQADTDTSCPMRFTTTVPTQSLGMLNGEFMNSEAESLAKRLERETPGDAPAQVRRAIRLTTGRQPSPTEVERDVAFIKSVQTKHSLTRAQALKQYCLLALNANEFMYVD